MSLHEQIHLPCQKCKERKFGKDIIYVNFKKWKFLCKTCCPPKLKYRKPGDKMINSPDTLANRTDFNSKHQDRFSKVLEIMGFNKAERDKALNSNFYDEIRGNAKNLWDKRSEMIKRYQRLNKQYFKDYDKNYKRKIREDNDKLINQFYLDNEIPNYQWSRDEFRSEEDFQSTLQWKIVREYKIEIKPWLYLEQCHGFPDIYIPQLDLIVEVKLNSKMWDKSKIISQVTKYKSFSEVVIVSLDGCPPYWSRKDEEMLASWFDPKSLFRNLSSRLYSDN
jgi:hypothetical protein